MLVKDYLNKEKIEKKLAREGFGEALVELGQKNKNVVAIGLDITGSVKTSLFRDAYPDRFIEVGIAEQNGLGIAVGLAAAGKIPFAATYAVFCPGRNWDQIRISACYNKANVKFAGAHAGISVGPDGATHQALEDLALTRCLPNLTVLAPCDYQETKKATRAMAQINGPVYIRFGREATPAFTTEKTPFAIGQTQIFRKGRDITIIGCGALVYEALLAAEELAQNKIEAEVLNCPSIKPFDEKTLIASAQKTGAVVTVEEHQIHGGLGSLVAEVLGQNCPVPLALVGMPDSFGESGQPEELLHKYGMDKEGILKAAKKIMVRKKS
ncbi:MAG: transketolase [Candidatus Portnoybacteria bacterium CG10_big_fil_rev_8_21_14_0_10_44_7]|uniref:Transketolase n=1 Tax=Candidatus Portnoybacteria bacterium CG10_big_fil_rev_8_21_14_0_10_44_7 TaxID=1974816 RepID=A0A2M8KIC6_9BACT|nr:MAG: transketolase [Candidatus Portnoybacteria bacterium CG10_big_fil_rev_8_21_14_0_10_44_7]